MDLLPYDVWPAQITSADIPANNNALRSEALALAVISKTTTAQPASPADRDLYIIPASATGAQWSTFAVGSLALYAGSAWYEFVPAAGVVKSIGGVLYVYNGSAWVKAVSNTVESIIFPVGDETTALTTGTAKVTFRMPYAFMLSTVRASVTTAPAGSVLTVDINEGGVSILSTKLTIDASEKTSTTAVTPAVISDAALADDSEITIDIDTVGSTIAGAGLKVYLIGTAA